MESAAPDQPLSEAELSAIKNAAAWYAKYHARMITERADDPSAYAMAQRERYQALLSGLRKLGVRLRDPLTAPVAAPDELDREAA